MSFTTANLARALRVDNGGSGQCSEGAPYGYDDDVPQQPRSLGRGFRDALVCAFILAALLVAVVLIMEGI